MRKSYTYTIIELLQLIFMAISFLKIYAEIPTGSLYIEKPKIKLCVVVLFLEFCCKPFPVLPHLRHCGENKRIPKNSSPINWWFNPEDVRVDNNASTSSRSCHVIDLFFPIGRLALIKDTSVLPPKSIYLTPSENITMVDVCQRQRRISPRRSLINFLELISSDLSPFLSAVVIQAKDNLIHFEFN
jgi:hypothetical protein